MVMVLNLNELFIGYEQNVTYMEFSYVYFCRDLLCTGLPISEQQQLVVRPISESESILLQVSYNFS